MTLNLYEFNTYDDALKKAQKFESNTDNLGGPSDSRVEEKMEHMQQSLQNLALRHNDLCCTNCSSEGHKKDSC